MRGTNIIVSSTDSGLEAFSHNPADDSFVALPDRTAANTKYLNEPAVQIEDDWGLCAPDQDVAHVSQICWYGTGARADCVPIRA
jgi:hypothetical protein